jgi:hypothetical protein
MVQKAYLTQALDDLGYEWAEDERLSFFGPKVEVKVSRKAGFRRVGSAYAMVTRGMNSQEERDLLQSVTQRYVYHAAREKLEAQGFTLASEEEQEGRIHLVLRRMA